LYDVNHTVVIILQPSVTRAPAALRNNEQVTRSYDQHCRDVNMLPARTLNLSLSALPHLFTLHFDCRQTTLFALFLVSLVCVEFVACSGKGEEEENEPHLLNVLAEATSDVKNIIQTSPRPLRDLQEILLNVYVSNHHKWITDILNRLSIHQA
jgi:hypothetical protein